MEGKEKCLVELVNEDGSTFAQSLIKDGKYEHQVSRCLDSSRFFALLLVNPQTQQRANIGVQFPERNDSFDFIQALDQYVKYYQIDKGINAEQREIQNTQPLDFSIKQGQKITLNIKGVGDKDKPKPKFGGLKKLGAPKQAPTTSQPHSLFEGLNSEDSQNDFTFGE